MYTEQKCLLDSLTFLTHIFASPSNTSLKLWDVENLLVKRFDGSESCLFLENVIYSKAKVVFLFSYRRYSNCKIDCRMLILLAYFRYYYILKGHFLQLK